ncbi:Peptidase S8, subtilisin, Ser-active site [Phytophthora cactorum]|nr:Peptidase S8, subtilisin, Ser-active site [Phytophthora cactorum]
MFVVSGVQTGLLGNLLGTVTGVVTATLSSLVKIVGNLLYDSRRLIIVMDGSTKPIINAAANTSTAIWTEAERVQNIQNIVDALKQHAQQSQGPVTQLLAAAGIQFKSNWISNTIEVLDCPVNLVEQILRLLSVKEIIYDIIITLDPPEPAATRRATLQLLVGGVVVGTIDTGVRSTHETLVNNWIGPYGWYDPAQKTATPFDANGHGTHTMATIVGGREWGSLLACGSSCTLSLLNACAQFMLCPTDTNGNNCNAAKAPHIVSNSWGTGQGLTYFQPMLDAWSAARIIPVFSAGNSGANGCSSVVSPGDSAKAFSIGASDTSDALGSFSSIGPAVNGLVKPDFIAPGVSIRSAWNGNNADYMSLSGTSMAAPHFAGTIALALSARPGFCFDSLKEVLTSSTDRSLPTTALTCGGISDTVFPNNEYGYGRINAQNVVNAALAY